MTKSPKFIQPRVSTEGLASTKVDQLRSNLREMGELGVRAESVGFGKAVQEKMSVPTLSVKKFSAEENEALNKHFRAELKKALDDSGGDDVALGPVAVAVIGGVASGVASGVAGAIASKKVSSAEE